MISAFALGGAVLDEPRYAEAARRAAEFRASASMYDPRNRHPAAPLPRRATPPFPAFSTITRCSPRPCSISTKRSSTCATWSWPSGSPKSSWSCSRTTDAGAFFSTAAGDQQPGDARQRGLRRRRAFGQFGGGDEPAAPGADHQPRGFPRVGGANAGGLRPAGCSARPWRCRRCWRPASSCWASRARSSWSGERDARRYAALLRELHRSLSSPTAWCCWWIRRRRARAAGSRHSGHRRHEHAGRPCGGIRLPQLHLPVAGLRSRRKFAELLQY